MANFGRFCQKAAEAKLAAQADAARAREEAAREISRAEAAREQALTEKVAAQAEAAQARADAAQQRDEAQERALVANSLSQCKREIGNAARDEAAAGDAAPIDELPNSGRRQAETVEDEPEELLEAGPEVHVRVVELRDVR